MLQKGNFTSINRNIDPNGKGLSRAAPGRSITGCQSSRPKHKGLVCVINDAISPA